MGYAARANPRSFDGSTPRSVLTARLVRFAAFFPTRTEYEAYLTTAKVDDTERAYLEGLLPERLRVQGSV